jgi:hypothetical protein
MMPVTPGRTGMRYVTILWDDGPDGNVEHIAYHGLTPDDVESVLQNRRTRLERSRSTGRLVVFGHTATGRYVMVAFDEIDEMTVYPITAYDVPEPG